jgi:allantoin racemase
MKIKIINPNTCLEMTHSIEVCAKKYANSGTEIIAVSPERGPITIEDYYDEALATVGVMEEIRKGTIRGF